MKEKVVLAYSGGVDTSVAIKWIAENYDMDVIALSIDIGMEREYEAIRQKALKVGAIKALVVDAKDTFVNHFVFPALQADAIYERSLIPDVSRYAGWSASYWLFHMDVFG